MSFAWALWTSRIYARAMTGKYVTERLSADAAGLARAAELLREGELVALPTETVYGLAARADSATAVARIYAAKGRPSFNPLIVHVADWEQLSLFTDPERVVASWGTTGSLPTVGGFAEGIWPGPVSLVVPLKEGAPVAPAVTAGLSTIALRMPNHRIAREVISAAGPIAMPSANRSGFISPTTADHVLATLDGRIRLVLDGGPTVAGVESTILKLGDDGRWEELRPGPEQTELWHPSFFQHDRKDGGWIEAPGQLASHYAPGKPVRLGATEEADGEFLIGFGSVAGRNTLSAAGDLAEAASRLYACLHEAAASAQERVAVAPIPAIGLGIAINDRLRRAATPAES